MMHKWQFFDARDRDITDRIGNEQAERYVSLIRAAAGAQATPYQSRFFVRTAARTRSGRIVTGGNHEKGITDTLTHGEEAVLVAAAEQDPSDPVEIIAFDSVHGGVARCCGNCRDALQERCPDATILTGVRQSRAAHVMRAEEFFCEEFTETGVTHDHAVPIAAQGLLTARAAFVPEEKRSALYGAAVVDAQGRVFPGSFFGTVNYTPTNPVQSAINAFWTSFSQRDAMRADTEIDRLVLVGVGRMPRPLYKDRQFFTELSEEVQAFHGRPGTPLPVHLYQLSSDGEAVRAWRTDVYEWMPHPFSPYFLGMGESLGRSVGRLLSAAPAATPF